MRRSIPLLVAALVAFVSGCADAPGDWEEHVGVAEDPIINGIPDTTHDAVVALFGQFSACTGTIIAAGGGQAYILTAAHCFEQDQMQQAAVGANYQQAQQVLQVADWAQHPSYDPNQLTYDFAMIRATGGSNLQVIPVLSDAEDALSVGTALTHVGYGLLSSPNGSTTRRHYANGSIEQLYQLQLEYNQPTTGPCSGDSGGPSIANLGNGERVAGVISFGDPDCASYGVSGRASAVFGWISDFMGVNPTTTSASSSTTNAAATTAATTSSSASGAGGATSAGVGGAGGATSTGTGWVAGDADSESYSGEVLSSCSAAPPTSDGSLGFAFAGLLGLGLWGARRRTEKRDS